MSQSPFMTTAEAAEYLNLHPDTLRYWRHKGRGPRAALMGSKRRVVYRRSDLETWIEAQYEAEDERLRELHGVQAS
jgi:excisionase family DNA binding protein